MADVDRDPLLKAIRAAADPVRLRILMHAASRDGHVRATDAKQFTGGSPSSGTAQYHLATLVEGGLLTHPTRGGYVLTPAGQLITKIELALVDEHGHHDVLDASLVTRGASPQLDALFPDGAEIVAELRRRLHGKSTTATVRITRRAR